MFCRIGMRAGQVLIGTSSSHAHDVTHEVRIVINLPELYALAEELE